MYLLRRRHVCRVHFLLQLLAGDDGGVIAAVRTSSAEEAGYDGDDDGK